MPENVTPNTPPSAPAPQALELSFEALTTYTAGSGRAALLPLDEAVVAALANPPARSPLEQRLVGALKGKLSSLGKAHVCRKLNLIGSAASVAALADLLADADTTNAARDALEAIPGPEAAQALRDRLPKLQGSNKVGAINSLGQRRDTASVSILTKLLQDPNAQVAAAAIAALGQIASSSAAKALVKFAPKAPEPLRAAATDACLSCAERSLADGRKMDAVKLYTSLGKPVPPKHVHLAITRGLARVAERK